MASATVSLLYFVGMLLVFVSERIIAAGSGRALTAVGVALAVMATTLRDVRRRKGDAGRQRAERMFLLLQGVGVLALALYFVQSDLATKFLDGPLDRHHAKLAGALTVLYPALWVISSLAVLMGEFAYAAVAQAPSIDVRRIRDGVLTGLGVGSALVFVFALNYVATVRDKKVDLSYFRTARPGEATHNLMRSLDAPVNVTLFFSPQSEVRAQVDEYFSDLKGDSTQLHVETLDFAVEPMRAKELGVTANNTVVVAREKRHELLVLPTELESARSQLSNLDKEIQKRMLLVARPTRTVYLTSGHGERAAESSGDTDKRATIRSLREILSSQGYTLRNLGAAEGLATDVPNDAAAVLVVGPEKPFLPEEIAALSRYFERSGRVFVALDPEVGSDYKELTAVFGVRFSPILLANDQVYGRRTYQPSDRINIATGTYTSHPSVTTLSHAGMRAPIILVGAGSLEEDKSKNKDLSVDFSIRALPSTFADLNHNFEFDAPAETRRAYNLAAVTTKKKSGGKPAEESRAFIFADSDALGDAVIGATQGNPYLVLDPVKWLLGEEAITGEVSSEVDKPIAHTQKQEAAWFYCIIFVAPALVLGLGFFVTRNRKRKKAPAPSDVQEAA